ncbi:MAG: sulfatase-like hydrolase/transferase [Acidobacteriota bacterium]|nr:sulfatase-like hydrolase/transferase [Acidobacteriota bacterium]
MKRAIATAALLLTCACGAGAPAPSARPSILIVTLDTTRADAIGPAAAGVSTPAFNAVAARGRRFTQAYATVPETLPSHSSMMTGLYPAGHGVHENARALAAVHPVVAERLQQAGYRTAAFVSSFVLARRFGLARGFETYDDELPAARQERSAKETTDRALAYLAAPSGKPVLLWVHYFEPHTPYAPAEPYLSRHAQKPYLGEIEVMDAELARLVQAFGAHASRAGTPAAIVIAGDHGEGLGDHGEAQHGHLLYQSTMHVPLVIAGPGVDAAVSDGPVSTRRVFHTVLDWAGLGAGRSLRADGPGEVVLGEAMKPYLEYGWQPQIMAVDGRRKGIFAGRTELFDVASDPGESRDTGRDGVPSAIRKALDDYPVPPLDGARVPANMSAEAQRNLASLGYVSASAAPVVRKDAPRPADMMPVLAQIEQAGRMFVEERYAQAVPLYERILERDPYNLDAALRIATSHSSLGWHAQAEQAFRRASSIAPRSPDVRVYLAMHYARTPGWERAMPMLEQLAQEMPERAPVVEALGTVAMRAGRTSLAIQSFERSRALMGAGFRYDLELGVLYLAERRIDEARQALDRVPASHPAYPMALFKRAQVSALLDEPDKAARIALARRRADTATRPLIERERLFK